MLQVRVGELTTHRTLGAYNSGLSIHRVQRVDEAAAVHTERHRQRVERRGQRAASRVARGAQRT